MLAGLMGIVAWFGACGDKAGNDNGDIDGGQNNNTFTHQETLSDEYRVEPGDIFTIQLTTAGQWVPDPVLDPRDDLSDTARNAVEAAPAWVQDDLARTLAQLTTAQANTLAAEILAADSSTVDEIAWSIAATHPNVLAWILDRDHAFMFTENAEGVYAVDGLFQYASLVELGDGRTTLEVTGENGTYQLDPLMYYRHVVYPRAYIDLPAVIDNRFWRTLFRTDTTYGSTAVDSVAGAQNVQAAARLLGEWIQSYMEFGYDSSETWPVRIYFDAYGSCGEYSILTTAAAKTVFIPTLSVAARADDHEWNELWDERWIMWDNSLGEIGNNPHYPYIDMPEIMDVDMPGSAVFGEVAHVFRFRPDEHVFTTDLYTPMVEVNLDVTDSLGEPVEGVRIMALSGDASFAPCMYDYTDSSGMVSFLLGDDINYTFEADHPILGDIQRAHAFADTHAPGPLAASLAFESALPRTLTNTGNPDPGDMLLQVSFTVTRTEQHRFNYLTEPYNLDHSYRIPLDGGVVDLILVDEQSYQALQIGDRFGGTGLFIGQREGTRELRLSSGQNWYLVIDNRMWPNATRWVDIDVTAMW
jgi:hypothetical protein